MRRVRKFFVFIVSTFLLGCGEESNYTTQDDSNSTPTLTQDRFNGIVVDGYIKNAKVCFDRNLDGVCSTDEQTTQTDANGRYQLYIEDLNATLVEIIATEGEDTSTNRNFSGVFRTVLKSDTINTDSTVIISPMTDLVAQSFFNSTNRSVEDLADAKNLLSQVLDLNLTQLEQDPMICIDLFALSQEIEHTKLLLEAVSKKNKPQVDMLLLESEIKTQLIELDFDIEKILIALEIRLEFSIPEKEKTFVTAQAKELKNQLNSLSKDTSLNIENLNRLQKALDIKQQTAYELIASADENSTLQVVTLNITGESLTQTNFNTTNAIFDADGCVAKNGFHALKSNAFFPETVEDTQNGVGLKSSYSRGEALDDSELVLYYPSLNVALSNDVTVVFDEDSNYYFTFDKSWEQNSNRTVYVKTPADTQELSSCYRYELSSSHANEITVVKVFSYSELD